MSIGHQENCGIHHRMCADPAKCIEENKGSAHLKEVDIQPWKASVNEQTVELLEQMLKHAKAGVFQEVMVIGIPDEGGTVSCYTPTLDFVKRLGAIEWIKHRWIHHQFHGDEPEPIDWP